MGLHGRKELLAQLRSSSGSVTLLVGDSGTGKSAVLNDLQRTSLAIAPGVVQVRHSPGGLQLALLEGLAAAVSLLTSDRSAVQKFGDRVLEAASKAADLRVKDLRRAVGKHFLGLVRARVGDDIADLIADFAKGLSTSGEESLAARISTVGDSDVISEIVMLATEVKGLAEGQEIHLAFDDLDRLHEEDLCRFEDLCSALPEGVFLFGSFTTWDLSSRERAERLQLNGSKSVAIGGISAKDLRTWLLEEGLDPDLTDLVLTATNGYPAHVSDAVSILKSDPSPDSIRSLQPDEVIRVRTRSVWRALDSITQAAAAKLVVYRDRLSNERIRTLLGFDEIVWGTFELRLIDAGLFLNDGERWFHQLRRRALWDLMTLEMRSAAIETAKKEIGDQLGLPGARPTDYIDFARVSAEALALGKKAAVEAGLAEILGVTRGELAVAAAALELIEHSVGRNAVNADVLLTHANATFAPLADPIAALEALKTLGLVHIEHFDDAAIVVPTWGSVATVHAIMGRAADELGRMPIASFVTTVFERLVRPHLGSFEHVACGIGFPSIAHAASEVRSLHRIPKDGVVNVRWPSPGLVIRGAHGGVPFFALVSYLEAAHCAAARDRLRDSAPARLFDHELVLNEVLQLPLEVVPSLRFVRALAWLKGRPKFNVFMPSTQDAHRQLSVHEELAVSSLLQSLIRERSSRDERLAYQAEQPTGFAYAERDGMCTIFEISNFEGVRQVQGVTFDSLNDPFVRLKLIRELGLSSNRTLRRTVWKSGSPRDPVSQTVVDHMEKARSFNSGQSRLLVRFEEAQLREILQDAFALRESDGRAILNALPDMGLELPEPTTSFVMLHLDEPQEGWVPGAHASLYTMVAPRVGDKDVVFAILPPTGRSPGPDPRESLEGVFGIDLATALSFEHSDAIHGLSQLLGYGREEIRFAYET
jgi:hypothetical protein